MSIEERKKDAENLGSKHGSAGKPNANPYNPMSVYHFHY